jgi:hypothetical protein
MILIKISNYIRILDWWIRFKYICLFKNKIQGIIKFSPAGMQIRFAMRYSIVLYKAQHSSRRVIGSNFYNAFSNCSN